MSSDVCNIINLIIQSGSIKNAWNQLNLEKDDKELNLKYIIKVYNKYKNIFTDSNQPNPDKNYCTQMEKFVEEFKYINFKNNEKQFDNPKNIMIQITGMCENNCTNCERNPLCIQSNTIMDNDLLYDIHRQCYEQNIDTILY